MKFKLEIDLDHVSFQDMEHDTFNLADALKDTAERMIHAIGIIQETGPHPVRETRYGQKVGEWRIVPNGER